MSAIARAVSRKSTTMISIVSIVRTMAGRASRQPWSVAVALGIGKA